MDNCGQRPLPHPTKLRFAKLRRAGGKKERSLQENQDRMLELDGRLIHSFCWNGEDVRIDLTNERAGIYQLIIEEKNQRIVKRVARL